MHYCRNLQQDETPIEDQASDFHFHMPSSILIVGPSSCGKTYFTKRLLMENLKLFQRRPKAIVYCTSVYQECFEEMAEAGIQFHKGIPNEEDLDEWFPKGQGILVMDDLMNEGSGDKRVLDLFTRNSHDRDITVLYLCQDMCHIGEWHSHHQLHLFQPSGGDSSTVIRNYPSGVCGFLLIIANIVSSRQVEFSPYLYTKTSTYNFDQKGKIVLLRTQNAFRNIGCIRASIERGKEIYRFSQGALHSFREYSPEFHEPRGYPFQPGETTTYLPRIRQPSTRIPQHRPPKQGLPKTREPVKYQPQPWTRRKYSPQSPHTKTRENRPKSAKSNNKLENRPSWM